MGFDQIKHIRIFFLLAISSYKIDYVIFNIPELSILTWDKIFSLHTVSSQQDYHQCSLDGDVPCE